MSEPTPKAKNPWTWPVRVLILLLLFVVAGVILSIALTGCAPSSPSVEVNQPVAEAPVKEETPVVATPTVEEKVVEMYRTAIPETTLTDEDIILSAENTAESLLTHLEMDGTGSEYLTGRIGQGEDSVVVASEIAGAIALHPEIADHPNYNK